MAVDRLPAALAALAEEYEILREIGRGGTAFVFLARERATEREVAIKLMRAKYAADDESLARFAREAHYVEALDHPNVVPVYAVRDLGEHGMAIVMGHIAGRTLKQMIYEDGALGPDRVERVMRDMAGALSAVHAMGLVHRDVKPENIFISDDDGRALLADFGIARSMHGDTQLTMTGVAIGTPTYMAPEQIDGAGLDPRGDLYSLGLVAWEALAGRRPWEGQSLYAVIYSQKNEWLPDVRELRDDVPDLLAEAIDGCLEKDRDARWPTAAALLDALDGRGHRPAHGSQGAAMDTIIFPRHAPPIVLDAAEPTDDVDDFDDAADTAMVDEYSADEPVATVGEAAGADELADANDEFDDEFIDEPSDVPYSVAVEEHVAVDEFIATGARRQRIAMAGMMLLVICVVATMGAIVFSADRGVAAEPHRTRQLAALPVASLPRSPGAGTAASTPAPPQSSVAAITPPAALHAAADSARTAEPIRTDASGTIAFEAGSRVPPAGSRPRPTPTTSREAATPPRPAPTKPAAASNTRERAASPSVARTDSAAARPVPPRVAARAAPISIATGGLHSCMLGADGRIACWGANDRGQLGIGSAARVASSTSIDGDVRFTTITAGLSHSCALARGGAAYCWGDNHHGQLGDRSTVSHDAPAPAAEGLTFRAISSGAAHSCALDLRGTAWCWGANTHGQLGGGTGLDRPVPAEVRSTERFVAIDAGWNFTCALDATGHAACWGENGAGQLGDETTADRRAPEAVVGGLAFVSLSAGSTHACGVTRAGEAYCWGGNSAGQLGDGSTSDRHVPVRVATFERFVAVSAGAAHTCAITAAGAAYCWGRNSYGQLGDGGTSEHTVPTRVAGGHAFVTLRAFASHTCGATPSGQLYCWGLNLEGQLGDGTHTQRTQPVLVDRSAER